jgi:DNA repair protein SbcC/Rad50
MIPRRIYLKNFMSYRDPQEICFREAQLWALCGENGSGKSTVFDGITYALFDEHRLGKQHTDKLIYPGEDQLYVEFDFTIDENDYRVKRSHNRKGYATRQIMHLAGPNPPEPGRKSPQMIQETDSDDGFNRWIGRVIGLNYNAFTSSALLLQGKSDALIKARPPQRHEILTQIIDLDPYLCLFNNAKEKSKEHDSRKKYVEQQIALIEVVEPEHISKISSAIEQCKIQRKQYHDQQLIFAARKVLAEQWLQICEGRRQLQEKLSRLQALIAQEDYLKQQVDRYHELCTVVPLLQMIVHLQQKMAEAQRQLEQLLVEQSTAMQQRLVAEETLQLILQEEDLKRKQQPDLVQRQESLTQRQLELLSHVEKIRLLHTKRKDYLNVTKQLEAYAPDIDEQFTHMQQSLADLRRSKETLGYLSQIYNARKTWIQQNKDIAEQAGFVSTLHEQITSIHAQEMELLTFQKTAKENAIIAHASVTRCKTQLEEVEARCENLKKVDGAAQCLYCGQVLTPEHMQAEHQRLNESLQGFAMQLQGFQSALERALFDEREVSEKLEETQKEQKKKQKDLSDREQYSAVLSAKRQTEETKVHDALLQLEAEYVSKIVEGDLSSLDIVDVLARSIYPTEQDIHVLHTLLLQEKNFKKQVTTLGATIALRNELLQQRSYIEADVRVIEQLYSPESIQSIPLEYEQVSDEYKDVQRQTQELMVTLTDLAQKLKRQQQVCQAVSQREQESSRQIDAKQNRIENIRSSLDERFQQLPSTWRACASIITIAQLTEWENEQSQLVHAEQQFNLLNEERAQRQAYEQNLQRLEEDLVKIPSEARCSAVEIEQAIMHIDALYSDVDKRLSELSEELIKLEQQQQRRAELEKESKEYSRLSRLYKSLATHLGPNNLQRYLLQRAEQSIVGYANETLDKISNGMLRLELAQALEGKGTKALDLVVYNYAVNQTQPLDVEQLSGSQQFRVAVSLALGIGKYAGGESHRVESVIIDEGFGSLDTQGRRTMIQVLQALKDELACIILVSHQDEFFDEFENKYKIELVDQCTKVSIM